MYEEEKVRVLKILGDKALAIEDIGSTFVPGLGSKDIVDMMVGVKDSQAAEECCRLLESIGFTKVTPPTRSHRVVLLPGQNPGHHPEIPPSSMKYPSPFWNKHLLFRNYLRTHPEISNQYYELKKCLAELYGSDREGYTNAKAEFIEEGLATARKGQQ